MSNKWWLLAMLFVVCVTLTLAILFFLVIYTAPRMQLQNKIEDFTAIMPSMVAGVPADEAAYTLKTTHELIPTLLPDNTQNRQRGSIYYSYYCQFCHGPQGLGDGPVGQSYVPVPANLRLLATKRPPSEGVIRRMLTGVGHEPILERVVPLAHRPFIALYISHLGDIR